MTPAVAVAWVAVLLGSWLGMRALLRGAATRRLAGTRDPHMSAGRQLDGSRHMQTAVFVVVLLLLVALLAPLLAPFDPVAQPDRAGGKSLAPSLSHIFGTDSYSRDVFSRTVTGTRNSLAVAVLAVLTLLTLGTLYGSVAALSSEKVDSFMMRMMDALLAIPEVLLLMAVAAMWNSLSVPMLAILIGGTGWFGTSRLVRAEVVAALSRDYALAANAMGVTKLRLFASHLLPNIVSPLIVTATLGLGRAIVLEAGLAYLGIGLQPEIPSWGRILREGSENLGSLWWLWLFPGLAMIGTVMAFNTLGDGLRDAVDSRQSEGTPASTGA